MKLKYAAIALTLNLAACGAQCYLIHHNNVMRVRIDDDMRKLETLSQRVQQETAQMKQQADRLSQLRKLMPQPPTPDPKSKS